LTSGRVGARYDGAWHSARMFELGALIA